MLQTLKETILNPQWYIDIGGLYMLLAVVFAETGLFVGFFLPGDSLLFVAGLFLKKLASNFFNFDFGDDLINIYYVIIMIMISTAGILGNFVGYWFGFKSGPMLFKKEDSLFFKKKYLHNAKVFYDKNGAFTVIAARFLPIIRTFVPIVAGIVKMDFKKFSLYNIIGSFAWVFSLMLAGHILGEKFPWIRERIELIVVLIVLATTLPVILKFISGGKKKDYGEDE
jgi:Uncharacterized membrane-associated protein